MAGGSRRELFRPRDLEEERWNLFVRLVGNDPQIELSKPQEVEPEEWLEFLRLRRLFFTTDGQGARDTGYRKWFDVLYFFFRNKPARKEHSLIVQTYLENSSRSWSCSMTLSHWH